MSGKRLWPWGMAALVALAALAAGILQVPKAQTGASTVLLTGPETAHAQTATVCVSSSCQRDNPNLGIVAVAESAQTGAYLAAGGMTLYTLSADQPGSGRSQCPFYGGCYFDHPPFLLPSRGVQPEAGIPGTFGSYVYAGGPRAVTYNGLPLYFCSCDNMPGDRNGDGVTDRWGTWSVAKP